MLKLMLCDSRGRHQLKKKRHPLPHITKKTISDRYATHLIKICSTEHTWLLSSLQRLVNNENYRFDYTIAHDTTSKIRNIIKNFDHPLLSTIELLQLLSNLFNMHLYAPNPPTYRNINHTLKQDPEHHQPTPYGPDSPIIRHTNRALNLKNKENNSVILNQHVSHKAVHDLKNGCLAEALFKTLFDQVQFPQLIHDISQCRITENFVNSIFQEALIQAEQFVRQRVNHIEHYGSHFS